MAQKRSVLTNDWRLHCLIKSCLINYHNTKTNGKFKKVKNINDMLRPKTKVKTKVKIKTLEWYQWYSSAAFTVRGSHQRCSVRKYVLRDVAKFTGKHLCQSLFFDKDAVEACNFIKKRDFGTVVFLWILRNF